MGRVPLSIPLAVLVALILIGDFFGLRSPSKPPVLGSGSYSSYLLSVREARTNGFIAIAEIDSIDGRKVKPFKARLNLLNDSPEPIAGSRLRFTAVLHEFPQLPGVPDIVDLQADMRRQGVTATAAIPRDSIQYLASTHSLRYYCALANNAALNRLKRADVSAQTVDILAAILLGRTQMITDETRAWYSVAGLSHLLALSGMHVGIIAMVIAVALWPFYLGRHTKTRLSLTIVALFAYAAFTGFIPSVTRAVIMSAVYLLGRIIQRKSPPLNSLCLAAILILIVNPSDLYAAGFQMSFAAVAGIILYFPLINRVNRRKHPVIYKLVSFPALSVSAMALTGIVSAFHFHLFPIYFLVANMLVVPLVPIAVFSGILTLLFQKAFLSDFFVDAIDSVARLCAQLPGAVITGLYPPALFVVLLLSVVILFALAAEARNKFMIYESLILFIGICVCRVAMPNPIYPDREVYTISESRSTQRIIAEGGSCLILTDAKTPEAVADIEDRYSVMLRDFMAKRKISKFTVQRYGE